MKLVLISGGISEPSSTGMLATRIAQTVNGIAGEHGIELTTETITLRALAQEITSALVSGVSGPRLEAAVAQLREADAIIAATPVYKAGISGLFKAFIDVLDNDLLIAKPVLLAGTAGTARHALVVDESMRSLFAYLRALTVPTSVFSSTEDWGTPELGERIRRAAQELVVLAQADVEARIRGRSWGSYQHELGSNGGEELAIDTGSELMRLATGGSAG